MMKNSTLQIMSKLGACKAATKDCQKPKRQTSKSDSTEQQPEVAKPANVMEQIMNMCLSPAIKDKKHTPTS